MRKIFNEFREFAIKGNMFDMAIGIIIGASFSKVVNSIAKDLIMPPIGFVMGKVNFEDLKYVIQDETLDLQGKVLVKEIAIRYGNLLQTTIDFLIIALSIFVMIKVFNRLKRKAQDETETSVPTPRDIELLARISSSLEKIEEKI